MLELLCGGEIHLTMTAHPYAHSFILLSSRKPRLRIHNPANQSGPKQNSPRRPDSPIQTCFFALCLRLRQITAFRGKIQVWCEFPRLEPTTLSYQIQSGRFVGLGDACAPLTVARARYDGLVRSLSLWGVLCLEMDLGLGDGDRVHERARGREIKGGGTQW